MYGSLSGVEAIAPVLGTLDSNSTPTALQVTSWLEQASTLIDIMLAGAGYALPVDSEASAVPLFAALTQLYAKAMALEARGIDTLSGLNEESSRDLFARFYRELKLLVSGDLQPFGILLVLPASRSRARMSQVRRIDGYSATFEGRPALPAYEYPSE